MSYDNHIPQSRWDNDEDMKDIPNEMIAELAEDAKMGLSYYAISETPDDKELWVCWGDLDQCNKYLSDYTDDELTEWDVKLYLITPGGLTNDF